jgi:CheY-like chemotaxis protein
MVRSKGKNILIVDDDPTTVEILLNKLQSLGYETHAGMDGLQGLLTLQKRIPDLIILDVMMPNMDGEQFMNIIQKSSKYSKIPVMVLTSFPEARNRFMRLGCSRFCLKPFSPDVVAQTITALLEPRQS